MQRAGISVLVVLAIVIGGCDSSESVASLSSTTTRADPTKPPDLISTTTTVAVSLVEPDSTPAPTPGSGCEVLHAPGEYPGTNVFGEVEQDYWVIVPGSYDQTAPAPLYLVLAIGDGDLNSMRGLWRAYIDPDSPGLHVVASTRHEPERAPATLLSLVDEVSAEYCVDAKRIHVLGASSSAPIASQLACDAADRIASFFSGIGPTSPGECLPVEPVAMLSITGDQERDEEVLPGVRQWAEINKCDPAPLAEVLGSGVVRYTYQGCAADVVLYDIVGMGHTMPMHDCTGLLGCAEYAEVDYVQAFQQFFNDHPLP